MQIHYTDKVCKLPAKLFKVSEEQPFKVPCINSTFSVFLIEGFAISNYFALMCIWTNEMHKFLWVVFIFSLNGSTCFGLSLVHHQEQHLISHSVQLVHAGTSGGTVQLIKCCSWWWTNDSPKHVEPFNEKIKTIHKNLCISLVYIHIAIWFTVHTTSNFALNWGDLFGIMLWSEIQMAWRILMLMQEAREVE